LDLIYINMLITNKYKYTFDLKIKDINNYKIDLKIKKTPNTLYFTICVLFF